MNPAAKLAAFVLALVAALGVGAAVGAAVGPIDLGDEPAHEQDAPHGGAGTTIEEPSHGPGAHEGWGSH